MSTGDPGLTLGSDPWYGPTDLQVVTAIQLLGLDVFPFAAFDAYGRLQVEPKVTDELRRELNGVLEQPAWKDMFKSLSLFDNPGIDAFALGFRARQGSIRVAAFRQLEWSSKPEACGVLQETVAAQLLPQLREYGGKSHTVDPRWLDVLKRVIGAIFGEGVDDKRSIESQSSEAAAAIGAKTALELVLQLLEVANGIGRAPQVDCSVVWRYPTMSSLPQEQAKKWASISTVGGGPGSTCTGVLWDRSGHHVWHWANSHPWPRNFQFTPNMLWRSLYPSGVLAAAEPAA